MIFNSRRASFGFFFRGGCVCEIDFFAFNAPVLGAVELLLLCLPKPSLTTGFLFPLAVGTALDGRSTIAEEK